MREQVIGHKVGNRSGLAAGRRSGGGQRPTPRTRGEGRNAFQLRGVFAYLPTVLKLFLAAAALALVFVGYRAAATASFFQVKNVDVQGMTRASQEKIQFVVRRAVETTGVWNADLEAISDELQTVPWVRRAVVSRVLPDEIRVRITERVPQAVARMSSGRFVWVDDDAVLLGEMRPVDQMPPFFLRGWNEESTENAREENKVRVRKFLDLRDEWQAGGLSERVSEVNLIDLRDVRAQLAGDDSQIEVRLGGEELSKRLKHALEVLDERRQTPRGHFITYIDMSQGKRAIIGFGSGAHIISDESSRSETSNERARSTNAAANNSESNTLRNGTRPRRAQEEKPRAATRASARNGQER